MMYIKREGLIVINGKNKNKLIILDNVSSYRNQLVNM